MTARAALRAVQARGAGGPRELTGASTKDIDLLDSLNGVLLAGTAAPISAATAMSSIVFDGIKLKGAADGASGRLRVSSDGVQWSAEGAAAARIAMQFKDFHSRRKRERKTQEART